MSPQPPIVGYDLESLRASVVSRPYGTITHTVSVSVAWEELFEGGNDAWEALFAAIPDGWAVQKPFYDPAQSLADVRL
jgi:hypothetical protein